MAPKSKAKAKAKANANRGAGGLITTTNTPIYADVEQKLTTIKAHPLMAHIADEPVLTIAQGSRQAPFDKRSFQTCMERGDEYLCAANFFWQNSMVSPTPSVTILERNVTQIGQMSYPGPSEEVRHIQHMIHIGIPVVDFDPTRHLGDLSRISPCEFVLAAIDRCFMAVEAGASDEVIKSWKKAFTSTTFVFKAREGVAKSTLRPLWPSPSWASGSRGPRWVGPMLASL